MIRILSTAFVTLAFASSTTAFAAPSPTPKSSAKPATGVVCQLAKSGNTVHVQALNKGTAAVPAGTTFSFTIIGPTKKTDETITFKADLAPGKTVNITNGIKAANVVGCSPDIL